MISNKIPSQATSDKLAAAFHPPVISAEPERLLPDGRSLELKLPKCCKLLKWLLPNGVGHATA